MIWMLLILLVPLILMLIWPAWFTEKQTPQSHENTRLYQERTAELASSDWTDDEKAVLQLELDREFLASSDGVATAGGQHGDESGRMVLLVSVAFVAAAAWALYQVWGASNELRATELLDNGEHVELTRLEREELMSRLSEASKNHPAELEWGYLNARLLSANGQYSQAAEAFASILAQLSPDATADRAATLTLMAEARFFAADQKADQPTYDIILDALKASPSSRQALGLAGILAFELGKPGEALQHWKALWLGLPAGPESQVLAQGIQRAADRLSSQGEPVDLSWMQRAGIQVWVSISDEAKAAVSPDDLVFVLARAASGPPMPLAVQRLKVSDLPQQVTLSDAQAMAPGMNLSSFEDVVVVARVSRSGQPLPKAGDWQIESAVISHDREEILELSIAERVE